jgi:hypothetical protein
MLPKNEKSFHISVEGEITGERYEGTFACVCVPWGGLRNKIARDEIRETGDLDNISEELFLRSRWLANVQNRLVSWPEWWAGCQQGSRLLDDNVLKEVYDQCIEAEVEWRNAVKNKASETSPSQVTTPA